MQNLLPSLILSKFPFLNVYNKYQRVPFCTVARTHSWNIPSNIFILIFFVLLVVKEPPYSVKESGYAGFNLLIEICFRTDEEPKKVRFNYDLDLQPQKVQREKYVFRNPDEDLRRRLICGGGVCEDPCMFHYLAAICFFSLHPNVSFLIFSCVICRQL